MVRARWAGALAIVVTAGALPALAQVPLPEPHPERAAAAQLPMPRPHPERAGDDPIGNVLGAAARLLGADAPEPEMAAEDEALFTEMISPSILFTSAYRRLLADDFVSASRIARSMPEPAGALVIDWLIATGNYPEAGSERIGEAIARLGEWPGQALMDIRFEQALRAEEPSASEAVSALQGHVLELESSVLLLVRSLLELGRDSEAADEIRPYWREQSFSEEMETAILAEFPELLTPDDHRWRMARLFYDGETEAALRTSELLSDEMQALAEAWAAVNRNSSNASARLAAVPASVRSDPGFLYARLRHLIRTGGWSEAATLLASAPTDPEMLVDPEAWSVQRRDLARFLVSNGDYATAYDVASGHSALDRAEIVEAEFVAGWIALTYLNDPALALPHFERLAASSSLPLSQSRGHYWIARCHEALDQSEDATEHFEIAAGYPTTYYGQLALLELEETQLPLSPPAEIDDAARERFLANPQVRAVGWLYALEQDSEAELIARSLGDRLTDPADVALMAAFAESRQDHQLALQIGKLAANRGLAVDRVAFPIAAMPPGTLDDETDLALVLAVARQESAFNITAESSAGALGFLQILPSTAREVAGQIGLTYSEARLRSDAQYNAAIGAAYLRNLLARYDDNYALALAAFNAGLGRADRWIDDFGDPRSAGVDTVDWIERIPFDETRNYVQRVLENYQVYRAVLDDLPISLLDDLDL